MCKLLIISSILFSFLSFQIQAETEDWMIGTWVQPEKGPSTELKKLLVTRIKDKVTIQAWLGCDDKTCQSKNNPTKAISKKKQGFTFTNYRAGFVYGNKFLFVTLLNPVLTSGDRLQVNVEISEPEQGNYSESQIKLINPYPCTCIFNNNRAWNPEKIIWKGAFWKCTGYANDGSCQGVEKLGDVLND